MRNVLSLRKQVKNVANRVSEKTGVCNRLECNILNSSCVTADFSIGSSYMYSDNGIDFIFILRSNTGVELGRYASSNVEAFIEGTSQLIKERIR